MTLFYLNIRFHKQTVLFVEFGVISLDSPYLSKLTRIHPGCNLEKMPQTSTGKTNLDFNKVPYHRYIQYIQYSRKAILSRAIWVNFSVSHIRIFHVQHVLRNKLGADLELKVGVLTARYLVLVHIGVSRPGIIKVLTAQTH
jgi:hypothetical protein